LRLFSSAPLGQIKPLFSGVDTTAGTTSLPGSLGVTINGTVVGSASSSGMNVSSASGGPSTTVSTNGTFTLNNVQSGSNVTLSFRGMGVNTQVGLGQIDSSTLVTATFTRDSSNNMHLDRILCRGQDKEELEGRIDGLPPTTLAGTFTISGQNVQTDANTVFRKGDSPATFADLVLGLRVHVKGTPNAGGVLAKEVKIQDENVDLAFEVEGTISNFSGLSTGFQFMLDGKLIKGDATTTFDSGTFANLANGVKVEVKAQIKIGFLQAVRIEIKGS
jgi:hypothetical protein